MERFTFESFSALLGVCRGALGFETSAPTVGGGVVRRQFLRGLGSVLLAAAVASAAHAQLAEPSHGPQRTGVFAQIAQRSATPAAPQRGLGLPADDAPVQAYAQAHAASGVLHRQSLRVTMWLPTWEAATRAHQVPAELALLPFLWPGSAECDWQQLPALTPSWAERCARQTMESVAAQQELFNDWHLALAAHHAGARVVRAAQRQNQAVGLPSKLQWLPLPPETRLLIPALLGLARVVSDPAQFGVVLPTLPVLDWSVADGPPVAARGRASPGGGVRGARPANMRANTECWFDGVRTSSKNAGVGRSDQGTEAKDAAASTTELGLASQTLVSLRPAQGALLGEVAQPQSLSQEMPHQPLRGRFAWRVGKPSSIDEMDAAIASGD